MPIILSQRDWQGDPKYLDREWIIYHYPDRYRDRIEPYDRFIYHRPTKGAVKEERSTYFGHGILGAPYRDVGNTGFWWVDIVWGERFPHPVPLRDFDGAFFETGDAREPQFQFYAMRRINDVAYYRILAAGKVSASAEFSPLITTESVLLTSYAGPRQAPKDAFRQIDRIPDGTGYVPSGNARPDVQETAALQERARGDHQRVLELIRQKCSSRGGACWYNNNVDLFVRVNEEKFLIEAKSLVNPHSAVDRMRYGMGQLLDYGVRYRAELQNASPVLAFGTPPTNDADWIPTILDQNQIALVAAVGDRICALNERAQGLPFVA